MHLSILVKANLEKFPFVKFIHKEMQPLNFPTLNIQMRNNGQRQEIWDNVRKKWLLLTPEEWVRQHLIQYLHTDKGFPLSLMAVEKTIDLYGMKKRYDLVIYNNNGTPMLLAECKAPEVTISQAVFEQAARYNITMKVPYLLITNGLSHYCCSIDLEKGTSQFLQDIPSKQSISK